MRWVSTSVDCPGGSRRVGSNSVAVVEPASIGVSIVALTHVPRSGCGRPRPACALEMSVTRSRRCSSGRRRPRRSADRPCRGRPPCLANSPAPVPRDDTAQMFRHVTICRRRPAVTCPVRQMFWSTNHGSASEHHFRVKGDAAQRGCAPEPDQLAKTPSKGLSSPSPTAR